MFLKILLFIILALVLEFICDLIVKKFKKEEVIYEIEENDKEDNL